MAQGLDRIPLRIPEKWDAQWFSGFVRDVLAKADIRNAVPGLGISIDGNSDQPATVSSSEDIQAIFDADLLLAEANALLPNARTIVGEDGVVNLDDQGPGGEVVIGLHPHSVTPQKLMQTTAASVLLGRGDDSAGEVEQIELGAGLAMSGTELSATPAPVVDESGSNLDATADNAGNYTRFSHASPTYTFNDSAGYVVGAEYHGRYVGAGTLTITEAGGMTINPPAGGTLEIPPQGTFTVKIVAADEADLFGITVAA